MARRSPQQLDPAAAGRTRRRGGAGLVREAEGAGRYAPRGADRAAVGDLILGYRAAKILFTAARLELFDALAGEPRALDWVCAALGTAPRPTEALLDALSALGFLRKQGGAWELAPVAREHLLASAPGSLSSVLKLQDLLWEPWGELARVLKEGRPRCNLPERLSAQPGFTAQYIRAMFAIARRPAAEIAGAVDASGAERLLDVGGGSGAYSLAFLERWPQLRAELLDLPQTLAVTRELSEAVPGAGRLRLLAGDYRYWEPEPAAYELVLLSHVTHDEGEAVNRELVRRAHLALRPGGRVLVHDFMTGPDGTAPLFGALFSVHLGVYTEQGRTYRAAEYRRWLEEAGFADIEERPIAAGAQNETRLLVGRKAS